MVEKSFTLKLDKETPRYFKFKFSDTDAIITVYLKKELLAEKQETLDILIT